MMTKRKRIIFHLVSLALGIIGLIGGIECFLQIRGYLAYKTQRDALRTGKSKYVQSSNPKLRYEPRKNFILNGIKTIQKDGGRFDETISEKKALNEYRVAVLGDSIATQWAYPEKDNFGCKLIQDLTIDKSQKATLLNWSVHGYCTTQESELFNKTILKYKPDMLVLEFCNNDLETCGHPDGFITSESFGFHPRLSNMLSYYLTPKIHVYNRQFLWRYNEENYKATIKAFLDLKTTCDKNNIVLIVAYMPFFEDSIYIEKESFHKFHEFKKNMVKFWRENDIFAVDLSAELSKEGITLNSLRLTQKDFMHANKKGHAEIGRIIAKKTNEFLQR
jgi:lysophospholipase L1-like esterase